MSYPSVMAGMNAANCNMNTECVISTWISLVVVSLFVIGICVVFDKLTK